MYSLTIKNWPELNQPNLRTDITEKCIKREKKNEHIDENMEIISTNSFRKKRFLKT